MNKIKALIESKKHVYIHNDLGNCTYYFKNRFDAWGDEEGISLEIMAGLTMLAFTIEARMNFLGSKLLEDWDEKKTLKDKAKKIADNLELEANFGQEPFSTSKSLKEFRDCLAHGKPLVLNELEEVVATHEELEQYKTLKAGWENFVSVEFFNLAYEHTEQIWEELLKAAQIEVFETMTRGEIHMTFLAHIDE
jgi:hypothetical protein